MSTDHPSSSRDRAFSVVLWVLAGLMLLILAIMAIIQPPAFLLFTKAAPTPESTNAEPARPAVAQAYSAEVSYFPKKSVVRALQGHTEIPDNGRTVAEHYVIAEGDSLFAISKQFDLEPETIFWANYDTLNGSPDMLSPGLDLVIPPSDGIYYKWKKGDTVQSVAEAFFADAEDILQAPINRLDLANPVIEPGTYIMVPGGRREVVQWFQGAIPRGSAGTLAKLFGDGGCDTSGGGAFGDGSFGNPMDGGVLIGNDYIEGVHQGIDLGSMTSGAILAADSGLVVYSGWANGGYGNTVMIDHGNGYQTLYAHMSVLYAICGQSVYQGTPVGVIGSTGNSTGPHLHFEIRYMGLNDNPWNYIY